jgi:hypothetical protein
LLVAARRRSCGPRLFDWDSWRVDVGSSDLA